MGLAFECSDTKGSACSVAWSIRPCSIGGNAAGHVHLLAPLPATKVQNAGTSRVPCEVLLISWHNCVQGGCRRQGRPRVEEGGGHRTGGMVHRSGGMRKSWSDSKRRKEEGRERRVRPDGNGRMVDSKSVTASLVHESGVPRDKRGHVPKYLPAGFAHIITVTEFMQELCGVPKQTRVRASQVKRTNSGPLTQRSIGGQCSNTCAMVGVRAVVINVVLL